MCIQQVLCFLLEREKSKNQVVNKENWVNEEQDSLQPVFEILTKGAEETQHDLQLGLYCCCAEFYKHIRLEQK